MKFRNYVVISPLIGYLLLITLFFNHCETDTGIGPIGYLTFAMRGESSSKDFVTDRGFHIKMNKAYMIAGAFQAFFGIEGQSYDICSRDVLLHTGHPHTLEGCPTAGESRVCQIFFIDLLAEKNILQRDVPSRAGLYTAFLYFVVNYNPDLVKWPEQIIGSTSDVIPEPLKNEQFVYLEFTVDGTPMELVYNIELVTHVDEQNTELSLMENDHREVIYEISLKRWFDQISDYSDEQQVINTLRSRVYDWYSWKILIDDIVR